ncbi:MAG TPA: PHP domain-containing protein, partial [Usitatibacteraceae bacterium]|nr:PHP domain-containing protein [Usitatibacteraceae bacterium]
MLNFDLHNHSLASDGLLAPAALVKIAARNGCDGFALTDHDTLAGLDEARQAAAAVGLRFIQGVEISVTWPDAAADADARANAIHIVGLGIDPGNAALVGGLEAIRAGRRERAARIADDLARAGIVVTLEDALSHCANPEMIGRTHFARALVAKGRVKHLSQAFERYLTRGKPGYVPHRWAQLADAIRWIDGAGGIAVLAHPGRYHLDAAQVRQLMQDFMTAGGRAVEVVTGSHSPRQVGEFAGHARALGLYASRGADYHGPGESRFEPGMMP